jgi:GrpB-like predicted nucleotidyltransferase (UPF0157 family)
MGSIGAIFRFLAEAVGLASWWAKRRAAKADDPVEQNRTAYEQIDEDIAMRDSMRATGHADTELSELERLRKARAARAGDQQRPG